MLYEEKTALLRKGLFEVQNEVGLGRSEKAYHEAYKSWLTEKGIPFSSKAPHHLLLGGKIAHTFYPDLVAWDIITIELKAVARSLEDGDYAQLFDYLKRRGDKLGLLVNLGLDRVYAKRIAYEPAEMTLKEKWDYWTGQIHGSSREMGIEVRKGLQSIFDSHGTGYSREVVEKVIQFELRRRKLPFRSSPVCTAYFKDKVVDEGPLDCLVIADGMLLVFTALFDDNEFNVSRGLSFMKALGLEWGIAVNFGKKAAQFTGLRLSV